MKMYFFDVTIKVENRGVPIKTVLYKAPGVERAQRAPGVLNQFLEGGFQVVRIDRVAGA